MLPLVVRRTMFAARRFCFFRRSNAVLWYGFVTFLCDKKRQGSKAATGFGLCVSFSSLSAHPAWMAT